MSADNWSRCPRCYDSALDEYGDCERKLMESYGKDSPDVWVERRAQLISEIPQPDDSGFCTFREDYEWHTHDGVLYGKFRGRCTACGLSVEHSIEPIVFYKSKRGQEE